MENEIYLDLTVSEFKRMVLNGGVNDQRIAAFNEIKDILKLHPETKVFILGVKMYAMHMTFLLEKYCDIHRCMYIVEDFGNSIESALVKKDRVISLADYLENYVEDSIFFTGSQGFIERYKKRIPKIYNIVYGWVNDKPVLWTRKLVETNLDLYFETYSMLSDVMSQKLMVKWIKASMTGDIRNIFSMKSKKQYFNEILSGIEYGTYIDCGAYDGDTIFAFIQEFSDYSRIIAFEPDANNYCKLCNRIESEHIQSVELYQAGAYYRNGEIFFNANCEDATARYIIGDESGIKIDVKTIDSVINEDDGTCLIKMDIEGSELDALRGARKTIKKSRPALAICVYHKADDLITIPQYIIDIVGHDAYHFYLRYHGNSLTELVLYAIPR